MLTSLEENSFLSIALNSWVPTVLTIVLGGYLASVLFPRWQQQYQLLRQRTERRLALAEEIARFFSRYTTSWMRLIHISDLERQKELSKEERGRKQQFVEERNESRDQLYDRLNACPLYFSTSTCDAIEEFTKWDEENSTKRLAELPTMDEWRKWKARILLTINRDVSRL